MKLVWTQAAVNDLEQLIRYIQQSSPEAAQRVAAEIVNTLTRLPTFPSRGRKREEDHGREIVFAPWPYVAVYEVNGETLYIKAIRHISRDWQNVTTT